MMSLERHFSRFRKYIVGHRAPFRTPYGVKRLLYADWAATGRLYAPIEKRLQDDFGPFVGNTHTESTVTGTTMTHAYERAKQIIARHVGAGPRDVVLPVDSGMTGAVTKLERLMGLKLHERFRKYTKIPERMRPIIFVSHMEHHSNHTSWLETIGDLVVVPPNAMGEVDPKLFEAEIRKYRSRPKIAAISAGSNVTGMRPPYHAIAALMHRYKGLCFVDFAAAAPYIAINMHPKNPKEALDAIYFSPHKFLGGPGSSGILVFDSRLYKNETPDRPGGGTVTWTNPWGGRRYIEDIAHREDGGTPPIFQTIKAALTIELKEEMGVKRIALREKEMRLLFLEAVKEIPGLRVLGGARSEGLAIISFVIKDLHYNLAVKLLNDRFGIQTRGGCACAGTYGHYLLGVSHVESKRMTDLVDQGDWSLKLGFVRVSLHPVMTDQEILTVASAIRSVAKNFREWGKDYRYDKHRNEFFHRHFPQGKSISRALADW